MGMLVAWGSFTVTNASEITATVPFGATTGKIVVVTPFGVGTSSNSFIVSPPACADLDGDDADIRCCRFTGYFANGDGFIGSVTLNGVPMDFVIDDDGFAIATVPVGASTGKIVFIGPGGLAQSAGTFTVLPTSAPTVLDNFTPANGPVGTVVVVNGTNFVNNATSVLLNGFAIPPGNVIVDSPTQLHFTVTQVPPLANHELSLPVASFPAATAFAVSCA